MAKKKEEPKRQSQAQGTGRLYCEIDAELRDWLDRQKESEQRSIRVIVERALKNERNRINIGLTQENGTK